MNNPADRFAKHPAFYTVLIPVCASFASVTLATLIRMALDVNLGNNQAYGTFYVAVAVVAWRFPWWSALITMVLGYIAGDWFFLPPRHSFGVEDLPHLLDLLLYLLVTGTVVLLITRLRWTQDSLRQSELRFRVTAETVPDILFAADAAGRYDYLSRRFYDYTGLASGEGLGDGWVKALHAEDVHVVQAKWGSSVRTGELFEAEYRMRSADGSYRWFVGRAQPVRDASLQIVRWFGSSTEIEVQKQAQNLLHQEVAKRTAELRQSVQELEGFSYSLVHDMRAPLRAMVAYVELAVEAMGKSVDSESLEYLRRVTDAAQRMDRLILDAFNYTKILRGKWPIRTIEVAAVLRGIVETYPDLQPPAAEVTIEFASLRVRGNEAALTQVFANLLSNAVKFVAPGVHPRVRVRAAPQANSNRAVIWVEDNGVGVPPEAQERIFDMFQRIHRVDEYPGTGIGLAIVKKATERMGGKVGVESQLGSGSRFWIELPLAPDA